MHTDDIGYKLMLAFEGHTPPARILDWIAARRTGGFSLFRPHNYDSPAQVRELTASLQRAARDAGAECLRMAAGLVRVGIDTEPTTLALEADLDDHCSTTKGCYTGQEIVARIHTYGHVNRRLCLLWLAAGPVVQAPAPVHDDDDLPVGRVMHAVPVPDGSGRLGFGYLPKDFQEPGTRLKLADGAAVTVLSVGGA